jgi:glycosyltransferase involved in cell wall biosynthesis
VAGDREAGAAGSPPGPNLPGITTAPPPSADRQRETPEAPPGPLELSLVIPFFNPGLVLRTTVERAAAALSAAGIAFEIIAVDDGSIDGSSEHLGGAPVTELVRLAPNRGKGCAVRAGMARARGSLVGFIDADGDIPPEILPDLVTTARKSGADIVYGDKGDPGSNIRVPPVRRAASALSRALVSGLFDLGVSDTQTGVKLLREEVVRAVLPQMEEERFAFDLEIFILAGRSGFGTFVAAPVSVDKRHPSALSVRSARGILSDTLKLFWRWRVRRGEVSGEAQTEIITQQMEQGRGSPGPGRNPIS